MTKYFIPRLRVTLSILHNDPHDPQDTPSRPGSKLLPGLPYGNWNHIQIMLVSYPQV